MKGQILKNLILPRSSLKLTLSTCSIFFIDNIFAMFGGRVFQQTFGKPIGTHCVPLLTDLFLYSYEADFIHGLLIEKNRNETSPSL